MGSGTKIVVLIGIGAAWAAGCAASRGKVYRPERPGGPTYWESDAPREEPPAPGTRFDLWPTLDAGATPPSAREGRGTTDPFLWQESGRGLDPDRADAGADASDGGDAVGADAADAAPSDAQQPLRMLHRDE